jgi:hypothetical protein
MRANGQWSALGLQRQFLRVVAPAIQRQARYRAAHADGTPRARQLNSVTLRCYMFFMRWQKKQNELPRSKLRLNLPRGAGLL